MASVDRFVPIGTNENGWLVASGYFILGLVLILAFEFEIIGNDWTVLFLYAILIVLLALGGVLNGARGIDYLSTLALGLIPVIVMSLVSFGKFVAGVNEVGMLGIMVETLIYTLLGLGLAFSGFAIGSLGRFVYYSYMN